MSRLIFTKTAAPSAPTINKSTLYVDTSDRRLKQIDDNGVISVLNNVGLQNRNVLINGDFTVQQRVAVASTAIAGVSTTTRAGVVADRWSVTSSVTGATISWQQVDTMAAVEAGLVARFYGSIIVATTARKVMISQYLVANDMANLRGKKVRVSVKIKQKVGNAQNYRLGIVQLQAAGTVDTPPAFLSGAWSAATGTDPAWSANTAAIAPDASPTGENGTVSGNWLVIASTAGWVRSSAVFTIPTDSKGLYVVLFSNAEGGTTDNLSIAEFQLTEGADIVDYVAVPFGEALNRCQRFYVKTFAYTTVPATSAGSNTGEATNTACLAGATALAGVISWRYPIRMWKTPTTITLYNPGAGNALIRMIVRGADMGVTASVANLDQSVTVTATGVAATAIGDRIGIHITADAEIVV